MVDGRWSMVDGRWSMVNGYQKIAVTGFELPGHRDANPESMNP
jgi:hypothetical protein